jgi:ribonuclease VapC
MIVDSSALVAIVKGEAERQLFVELIDQDSSPKVSAASFLETAIVVDSTRQRAMSRRLDDFLESAGITVEPVTERQARIAREAYRDFGKGSGHPAALNFGDCFAYALAKDMGEPLLFKGDDLSATDVRRAEG